MSATKKCNRCKKYKDYTEFPMKVSDPDTILSRCYRCFSIADEWRQSTITRVHSRLEDTKMRACLSCDKMFESKTVGNRRCPNCKGSGPYRESRQAVSDDCVINRG